MKKHHKLRNEEEGLYEPMAFFCAEKYQGNQDFNLLLLLFLLG